jgi:hypothetical protein
MRERFERDSRERYQAGSLSGNETVQKLEKMTTSYQSF